MAHNSCYTPQPKKMKPTYLIGIDPGVSTGVATYDTTTKTLTECRTTMIHRAMEMVAEAHQSGVLLHVYVEDARKLKLPAHLQRHKSAKYAQGVGSVKRDCSIWESFLTDLSIPHTLVDPRKTIKKMEREAWEAITRYKGLTSSHSRDAAMLVWGR